MTREEQKRKLKAFITCLKCEVSGKSCDDNCPTQYEAGNMGEIIENLEIIAKALEQEPTTKNDLRVDSDKLIADCEKMSFDFKLFGRPTKALLLDAVKNIVKDLPSVTPQEPRWIPVSEKYPKIEDEYKYFLVTDDKGKVSVQEFFISLDEKPQPYFSGMVNVIAWMPLPLPYKAESEGI